MGMRPLTPENITGTILPENVAVTPLEVPEGPERSLMGAAFRQEFTPASWHAKWNDAPGVITPAEADQQRSGEHDYEDYIPEDLS